jgi:hypothetical protein
MYWTLHDFYCTAMMMTGLAPMDVGCTRGQSPRHMPIVAKLKALSRMKGYLSLEVQVN